MILPESEPQSHTASESFQRPSELVEKKNEVVPSESVLKINNELISTIIVGYSGSECRT